MLLSDQRSLRRVSGHRASQLLEARPLGHGPRTVVVVGVEVVPVESLRRPRDGQDGGVIATVRREPCPHGQDRELVCVEHGVSEQVTVGVLLDAVVSERDPDLAHRGP